MKPVLNLVFEKARKQKPVIRLPFAGAAKTAKAMLHALTQSVLSEGSIDDEGLIEDATTRMTHD